MSRMILVLSAAALIFASSQIAFADENGLVTGAVGGAVAGAVVGGPVGAVVGGVGGAAIGNSVTNHRHYHRGYAYHPYHHHYRSILTDRRRPVRGRRRGPRFARSESTEYRTRLLAPVLDRSRVSTIRLRTRNLRGLRMRATIGRPLGSAAFLADSNPARNRPNRPGRAAPSRGRGIVGIMALRGLLNADRSGLRHRI